MKKPVIYAVILMTLSIGAGVVIGMGIGRKLGYDRHLAYIERFGPQKEETRQHALAILNRSLGLSKEQTEKIGNILDGSRDKAEALKKETMKNLETIKENINNEIMAILTPDQQIKFNKLMTERKQHEGLNEPFCAPPIRE